MNTIIDGIGATVLKQKMERAAGMRNAKLNVSSLAFSQIPHQSRLFLEYLRDPLGLTAYYPNALRSPSDAAAFAPVVLEKYATPRQDLCDVLVSVNIRAGAHAESLANIQRLRNANTVAVVTGQQAGLFTGPLYTIYKAISAIRMSESLNSAGVSSVPVFWAATEDHDFDEVASTYFVNRSGHRYKAAYDPTGRTVGAPVGAVTIDEEIALAVRDLFTELGHTEFSDGLRGLLADAWAEGSTFADAFLKTMSRLLGRFGLVVLDPRDDGLKRLAAPLYAQAVFAADEIAARIKERSQDLVADGFHAQVHVEDDHFPLFIIDKDGRRAALRKTGGRVYRINGAKRQFAIDELAGIAAEEPHRLSPGVMLRPVVQDYLLPTICYFGGAAEIAYFAQNSKVYTALGRPVTPIFHRQSFTVVEASQGRFLEQFGLTLPDLFDGQEALLLRLARDSFAADTERLFELAEKGINAELDRLDQILSQIDPTLGENLDRRRRKIIYHIGALRKKASLAKMRQDETFERRFNRAFAALLPAGGLQERSINVFTYLNKFGPVFIDWIYDATDLDDKGHRVINL
ncbi:MAG TPA: bacillithiol biosynthesis cysteine-adding enzyme BshC [Pyrinomonadaceae bacterium]|nr:bacillithiol biosynthesis cysteine-adding enzyme BshC [Pyrinomonadaceae bacterium]